MARTLTLTELIAAFRRRGEYENSGTMTDAMVTDFVNEAIAEVHDILTQKDHDFTLAETTLTTTPGQGHVTAPTDFYAIKKLILERSVTDRLDLLRFSLDQVTRWQSSSGEPRRWRLQGAGTTAKIVLAPTPDLAYTLRLWYIPAATRLVAGGDVYDGINGYEELVLTLALYRADMREQRPIISERLREIDRLWQRVSSAADGRDSAEPYYLRSPRWSANSDELED